MRVNLSKCAQLISSQNSIALFCHIRPDGDTLGAALALKLALSKIGKDVKIFCEDPLPQKFEQFGFSGYFFDTIPQKYDLYVAIDCGDIGRLGKYGDIFVKQKNTLTIDHHAAHEDFGTYTCLIAYSSTCEIISELLQVLHIAIDDDIAAALFIGLSTDTGNFRHSNTDKHTFLTAANLVEQKIDVAEINRKLYAENKFSRLKLLSRALQHLKSYLDGKLFIMYVTLDDFKECGATMEDTEGFTDYAISVDTALIGVSISQSKQNAYKVSMRSKGVDVAEICGMFGGGGHKQASGCTMCGFLEDIIDKIVNVAKIFL